MTIALGWFVYAVAFGALVSAAAVAVEAGLTAVDRPARHAWWVAGLLTALAPLAALRSPAPDPPSRSAVGPSAPALPGTDAPLVGPEGEAGVAAPASGQDGSADRPDVLPAGLTEVLATPLPLADVARVWGGATALLALLAVGAAARLARCRRGWTATTVAGLSVEVSTTTGPATVGLLRAGIVVPRDLLTGDPDRLRAALAHEAEHVRAHDLRLLAGFGALVTLVPWQPWLWWQLRRLALAVEVDCDRRTLASLPELGRRRYGSILLDTARERGHAPRLSTALRSGGRPLETRIRRILHPGPGSPGARHRPATTAVLAALALTAACELPGPAAPLAEPREPTTRERASTSATTLTGHRRAGPWTGKTRIVVPRAAGSPASGSTLEGVRGGVALDLFVDGPGRPRDLRIDAVTEGVTAAMVEAVVEMARALEVHPPGDRAGWVPVWYLVADGRVLVSPVALRVYRRNGIGPDAASEAKLASLMETVLTLRYGESGASGRTGLIPRSDPASSPSVASSDDELDALPSVEWLAPGGRP